MNKRFKNGLRRIYNFFYYLPGSIICRTKMKINGVTCGYGLEVTGNVMIQNYGSAILGNSIRIRSGFRSNPIGCGMKTCIRVYHGAELVVGNHVKMSNTNIACQEHIVIEDEVMIGGGVRIWDTDFHSTDLDIRMELIDIPEVPKTSPIIIKRGAFVGAGSYILKGVTIGEKSIVGAASVVTKDIPDNQIWAGNPAKYIKDVG